MNKQPNADNARPDRIWIDGCAEHSWFPDDGTEIYQADTLYIRKGAFPVEEIRRQVGVLSQAPRFLKGSDLALFRRILSLLEGPE